MMEVKPKVVVSRCIEFDKVRHDGQIIKNDFVERLKSFVDFIPVCPEVEIGLSIPRESLRIVASKTELRLLQPKTDLDLTSKMMDFISSFFGSIPEVDVFILKNRSPTSALKDAKIYSSEKRGASIISKGPGLFGKEVLKRFGHLAVEDDGRLRNPRIREHFLTKLYAISRLRSVLSFNSFKHLVDFHTKNKLLLKVYSQRNMRILGRVIANTEKKSLIDLITSYEKYFFEAFKRPPRRVSNINVLMNSMGYFSDRLSKEEKTFFLNSIEAYRKGSMPLGVLQNMMKLWIIRFKEEYLLQQTYFKPYPKELVDIEKYSTHFDQRNYWN
jgi:uncharacterized protein YbgA (DUF1722 family)/uncharacterized protein YbbK (DUF523 family)